MRTGAALLLLLIAACAPRVERAGPPAAEPGLTDDAFVMADGYRLPQRSWGPERDPTAVVLALHGFNDYSAFIDNAGRYWAERGIRTVAYDQRGFGKTEGAGLWHGAETLVADARAVVSLVRQRYPDRPLILFGESMGGAVVLSVMGGAVPPPVDGAIMSAPAAADWEALGWFTRAGLWLAAHTVPWMEATGANLDIEPSDNIEMLRALGRDPLVIKRTRIDAVWGLMRLMDRAHDVAAKVRAPALVLYGEKEELIPDSAREALLDRLPPEAEGVERRIYPDGYHMLTRDLGAEKVLADIAGWVLKDTRLAGKDGDS